MTARAKPGTARRAMDDAMSEDDWERTVLDLADRGGWMAFHPKPVTVHRRGAAYRHTAQVGDNGFPDWCFARDHTALFVELKKEAGRLSDDQKAWRAHLGDLMVVWRPRDAEIVRATLLAPRGADRVDVVPPRLRPRLPTNTGTPKRSTFNFDAVEGDERMTR